MSVFFTAHPNLLVLVLYTPFTLGAALLYGNAKGQPWVDKLQRLLTG